MKRLVGFSLVLLVTGASISEAQDSRPQVRQGFGIGFGLGFGSAGINCDGCSTDRETGASGYLRIGGYVNPSLFIGGETNGWTKEEDGVDMQAGFLSAVAQWYPQPASGFYLKGGLGVSNGTLSDDFDEISATGMGLSLGTGFDWRLGTNFSLTPYVNYLRSFGAEAELNGSSTGVDLDTDVLQFGLGFTWH